VDETVPLERPQKRKKKQQDYTSDKRAKLDNGDDKPKRERITTSVYVSNLPLDVAAAEVQEYFAKCGVIAEDAGGQKRVKLYYDEDGKFKGDALVTYFKPESVPLALQLLDETELVRADGRRSPLIRVQVVCLLYEGNCLWKAEFKSEEAGETQKEQKEPKKKSAEEMRKLQRRKQKLERYDDRKI
jgi:HIV Tat-specific factor 1